MAATAATPAGVAADRSSSRDTRARIRYFARNPPPEVLDANGGYKGSQGLWAKVADRPKSGSGQGQVAAFKDISREKYDFAREMVTEECEVPVVDARAPEHGGLDAWRLDVHGFQIVPAPPPVEDFTDQETVKKVYYPQLVETAIKATGASRGFVMTHGLREENDVAMTYALFAHGDGGPDVVETWRKALVKRGVPEEEVNTSDILGCNIWHPRDRPAFKNPLCILDASSTTQRLNADGAPAESAKYRTFTPTGFYALGPLYEPTNRWVFCSDMRPTEAWLFKHYDTRPNVAKCGFHNSFSDTFHEGNPEIPSRRSCEFTLVLTFRKTEQKNSTGATSAAASSSRL